MKISYDNMRHLASKESSHAINSFNCVNACVNFLIAHMPVFIFQVSTNK